MKIKNKHKTVEFWRRKMSILGNFRKLLWKKYQWDPLEILDGTRYMPCDCKSYFVLFLSLKKWNALKPRNLPFTWKKWKKVEKNPDFAEFSWPPSERTIDFKGLKTFKIDLNSFSMSDFLIILFEKKYWKNGWGANFSPAGVNLLFNQMLGLYIFIWNVVLYQGM